MARRLAAVLLVVIAWVPAFAQEPGMYHGRGWMGQGEEPMRILQGIKLTPDQETQVHKILEANRASLHDLFDQLRNSQDALATALLRPGNVTPADVKPLLDKTLQVRQQLAEKGLEAMLAVRGVLTPDQIAKAAERRARIKDLENQIRALEQPN